MTIKNNETTVTSQEVLRAILSNDPSAGLLSNQWLQGLNHTTQRQAVAIDNLTEAIRARGVQLKIQHHQITAQLDGLSKAIR